MVEGAAWRNKKKFAYFARFATYRTRMGIRVENLEGA